MAFSSISLTALAKPRAFQRLSARVRPWSAAASIMLFALGLYFALVASPPDYQQGDTVRIMYVHVPAAWMAMLIYAAMAVASLVGFVWRHPLAELFVQAAAPIGATFTAICLITGSLWGKPMWGAWWVWDARLTSVLILFFLYVGYIELTQAFDDPARGLRAGSILVMIGAVNLPIIKFSVDWWNTLHQPASIFRMGGPTVDPAMLRPLFIMGAAYLCLFVTLVLMRLETGLLARRLRQKRIMDNG
jgi:heme exporter protein C